MSWRCSCNEKSAGNSDKIWGKTGRTGRIYERAFLNGRIDLSQAEAVIDVINATRVCALKSSVSQLRGKYTESYSREIETGIIYQIAYIESALDDPEHISIDGYGDTLKGETQPFKRVKLDGLLRYSKRR